MDSINRDGKESPTTNRQPPKETAMENERTAIEKSGMSPSRISGALKGHWKKRVGYMPTEDQLQRCWLHWLKRANAADSVQHMLDSGNIIWKAVGDSLDEEIRVPDKVGQKGSREREALETYGLLKRSRIGSIPTIRRYRTEEQQDVWETLRSHLSLSERLRQGEDLSILQKALLEAVEATDEAAE
jgi:hypothetical protein